MRTAAALLSITSVLATGCRTAGGDSQAASAPPGATGSTDGAADVPPIDFGDEQVLELFNPGCFETHLKEAIALNRTRRPLYSQMSAGATTKVSDSLIRGELAAIAVAKVHDTRASGFHRRGLTVLCDELISMSEAPRFDPQPHPLPPPSPLLPAVDPEAMKAEGLAALADGGFPGAEAFARTAVARLAPDASYFCMTMHLLESVLRAAVLAPKHAAKAAALGIDPPTSLSRDFISIQIKQLPFAVDLDRSARDLHQRGIPIVCQDVPKIPED
jgi:hypothetical protein